MKKKQKKKPKVILRSSNYNPVLINETKRDLIWNDDYFKRFELEVNNLLVLFNNQSTDRRLDKDSLEFIELPERIKQLIGGHATSVNSSIQKKLEKIERYITEEKKLKKYQEELLYGNKIPVWHCNSVELDSRFVSIEKTKKCHKFDYWIKITSWHSIGSVKEEGKKRYPATDEIYIPFNLTNHMKQLQRRGYKLNMKSIRLNRNGTFTLYFTQPPVINKNTEEMGVDIGMYSCISTEVVEECTHITGKGLHEILSMLDEVQKKIRLLMKFGGTSADYDKLEREKEKLKRWMRNQVDYAIKHCIPFSELKRIYLEMLNGMKTGSFRGYIHSVWSYKYIQKRIELWAEEYGVNIWRTSPRNTSKDCRCGSCNTYRIGEFKEILVCKDCGFICNANINAAKNIHKKGAHSLLTRKTNKGKNDLQLLTNVDNY